MDKFIKTNEDAQNSIQQGINTLANVVGSTLGPKGNNVVINDLMTKDGVTVARSIFLDDKFENMGAQMVKQASMKANNKAGDGTTTATVLTQHLYNKALELTKDKKIPRIDAKRIIDDIVDDVKKELVTYKIDCNTIDMVKYVAYISSNSDEKLSSLISESYDKVGFDCVIDIKSAQTNDDIIDIQQGLNFNSGLISSYFISDHKTNSTELKNNVVVLIVDGTVDTIKDILPFLEFVNSNQLELVIIAENVHADVLAMLLLNIQNGQLKVSVLKSPEFGQSRQDILTDISVLTGATIIGNSRGTPLSNFNADKVPSVLGRVGSIKSDLTSSTLITSPNSTPKAQIEKHIAELVEKYENDQDEWTRKRIASLKNGISVIYAGANSELELKEKMDRLEDAVNATKQAIDGGIVAGGGVTLIRIANTLKARYKAESKPHHVYVLDALYAPYITMMQNAGKEVDISTDEVINSDDKQFGRNIQTGELCNLIENGIIDPLNVTKSSIVHAGSIAGMMVTTSALVDLHNSIQQYKA